MKTLRKFQVIAILIFFVSAAAIVYDFVVKKFENELYMYIACALCGITLTYEVILQLVLQNNKKIIYLEQKMKLWNNISYRVKNAGESSFNELPLGIIVFDDDFNIEWSNNYVQEIFMSKALNGKSIDLLDKDLAKYIRERQKNFKVTIYGRVLKVEHKLANHILFFTDVTSETELEDRYKRRTLALGVLNLDNLDGAFATLDAQERSLHMSHIMGILTEWAKDFNICFKGYTDERYLLIMNYQIVVDNTKQGFSVINKIQEYGEKEGIRITTSIGIACRDIDPVQLLDEANAQLELALNRGGNQAIVKLDDEISYYGAKSASFETRTSVYIRIKTEELMELIEKIFIISDRPIKAQTFIKALYTVRRNQYYENPSKYLFDIDVFCSSFVTICIFDSSIYLYLRSCSKLYCKLPITLSIKYCERNPSPIINRL